MNKIVPVILFLSLISLATPSLIQADSSCQPLFGGGQSCQQSNQISIDKKVKNPANSNYVDNLGQNDAQYLPGMEVDFKLVIKNTSSSRLTNITVTDALPQFVEFVSGTGTFDQKTNTLTIPLASLAAGQEDVIFLQAKVVDKSALPANRSLVCVANQAIASVGTIRSQDNSQFCIQKNPPQPAPIVTNRTQPTTTTTVTKGGFTVYTSTQAKKTPATGPETWEMIALLPSGALGYWLRKKTSK